MSGSITKRRKRNYTRIQIWNHSINSNLAFKYSGVIVDAKLSYTHHLQYAYDKTSTTSMILANMIPKEGGPPYIYSRFIARMIRTILLYAVCFRSYLMLIN